MRQHFFYKLRSLSEVSILCILCLGMHGLVADDTVPEGAISFEKILPSVFQLTSHVSSSNQQSFGTAWIVHPSGIAITANHVVDDRQPFGVLTSFDKTPYQYLVLAYSPQCDLAFLKVQKATAKSSYNAIPVAKYDVNPGENVYAILNFAGASLARVQGIYSTSHLVFSETFVNPSALIFNMQMVGGGSGGPIVSAKGEVIAVMLGQTHGFAQGMSSKNILPALNDTANSRTISGLETGILTGIDNFPENIRGVLVSRIKKDSAAEKADIVVGDRITAIGQWAVSTQLDLELSCLAWTLNHPDQPMPITLSKVNSQEEITIELTLLPAKISCSKVDARELSQGTMVTFKNAGGVTVFHKRTQDLTIPRFEGKGEILFQGFLAIPDEGSYVFTLNMPGIASLTLGGKSEEFIVEKILPHPRMQVSKREYFERGDYRFSLRMEVTEEQNLSTFAFQHPPLVFVEKGMSFERMALPKEWLRMSDK